MSQSMRKSRKSSTGQTLEMEKKSSVAEAKQRFEKSPDNPSYRKAWAISLMSEGQLEEAARHFHYLIECGCADHEVYGRLSEIQHRLGQAEAAEASLLKALEKKPDYAEALHGMAYLLHKKNKNKESLNYIVSACKLQPKNVVYISFKAIVLVAMHRYSEALDCYRQGLVISPDDPALLNNYGNALNDLGLLDESIVAYKKAMSMPNATPLAFSNLITTMHYHPAYTGREIEKVCRQWNDKYAKALVVQRQEASDKRLDKVIRVGMVSDGFRNHPVGQMTISALEHCYGKGLEFYFYTTTNHVDYLTNRFKRIAKSWFQVDHLDDKGVADKIKDDCIDILVDLAGHNAGNKVMAMAMEPAPIIVKWVGGLINTTGVEAIDYLISDNIETPEGVDKNYTEKLVRLPDDYICYTPPPYLPEVSSLPAARNGYITFGCFNNAKKINKEVLGCWAGILQVLPNSRLFLKSLQFDSQELRESVKEILRSYGITEDRLCIEGPSSHLDLLAAYQRVDIALDPWPYSGGLTTCEAFLMGVPVITMPGPTFAGRHSATHLINAGMPELVVNSWDEYQERAVELASDLDSLATIRQHLRQVLLESPVCDAQRFATHFTDAIRAIWQRYCEGKPPAALTFDKEGEAWFEGESEPVVFQYAPEKEESGFNWKLPGKIIALDNSAKLVRQDGFDALRRLNAFGIVAFDPASRVENPGRFEGSDDVQVFPHAVLGDGQPGTLYACLEPAFSATLKPLSADQQFGANAQGARVLTQLPINTVSLDSIEGLESLDWLILDDLSDAITILEHGKKAIVDTLLIQVRVVFQPTHEHQPELADVQRWLSQHGFQFYRLNDLNHARLSGGDLQGNSLPGTALVSADALFLPDSDRLSRLGQAAKTKLAFLLHTVFGAKDVAFSLLQDVDEELASCYLSAETLPIENQVNQGDKKNTEVGQPVTMENEGEEEPRLPEAPHMSDAERRLFEAALKESKRYFEFGSGGSTVWAVNAGLTAYGVESDANWVSALKESLGERCQVEVVDIGPTREWGYPTSLDAAGKFQNYSRAILAHDSPFDLILVDGRFRVACVITAIQHLLSHGVDPDEARIFIHDFWDRPVYHIVLDFLEPIERVDTAGLFKLKKKIKEKDLRKVWTEYARQPA